MKNMVVEIELNGPGMILRQKIPYKSRVFLGRRSALFDALHSLSNKLKLAFGSFSDSVVASQVVLVGPVVSQVLTKNVGGTTWET